jgi:hypothetical protein
VFDRARVLVGILSLDDVGARARKDRLALYALSKLATLRERLGDGLPLNLLVSFSGPPIEHIIKAAMQPAFAGCVVPPAVDVLVKHVGVSSTETPDFLLEAKPCVLHEPYIAAVPEFAMMLDRTRYSFARRFDHVLMHYFAIRRRQFPVPVNDLRRRAPR